MNEQMKAALQDVVDYLIEHEPLDVQQHNHDIGLDYDAILDAETAIDIVDVRDLLCASGNYHKSDWLICTDTGRYQWASWEEVSNHVGQRTDTTALAEALLEDPEHILWYLVPDDLVDAVRDAEQADATDE